VYSSFQPNKSCYQEKKRKLSKCAGKQECDVNRKQLKMKKNVRILLARPVPISTVQILQKSKVITAQFAGKETEIT